MADETGELVPLPAARLLNNPLTSRPYKQEPKSSAQSMTEWRKACACALTFDDKVGVIQVLHQLTVGGNVGAATLLLAYGMGKPAVGVAGKLMDDVAADTIQDKLARLPLEKRRAALDLLTLLEDATSADPPVTIDAAPDIGEPAGMTEEAIDALLDEPTVPLAPGE